MSSLVPIILAGGSGTRLWPLSRVKYPKQFLPLLSDNSMLQDTLSRLDGIPHQPPILICNEQHRFIVAEQLRQYNIRNSKIILEPSGKNTAPAIALAALQALKNNADPIMLILAADHSIQDTLKFHEIIKLAYQEARIGKMVTFGIIPTTPETGYGYIQQGEKISNNAFRVDSFVEKPNLEKANEYLSNGKYLWNSGMFMFKASVYLSELEKYHPDILNACRDAMENATTDQDFIRPDKNTFIICPEESIDYAVMEKTHHCVVVPIDISWSDVGSWSSLWEISDKDSNGNVCHGDIFLHDSHDNYIYIEEGIAATIGINNLVVTQTKDAILIAEKNRVQEVKYIVERLKEANRNEYINHKEVFRPWGRYDILAHGKDYQIKKIIINPGEKISTQIHKHRSEHWVIVSGIAKITNNTKSYIINKNESSFIPVNTIHSLENPGKELLEIIEIQSGSYLSEDDIIRIDDSPEHSEK
ncbi:mannose-1-phosphate guanylyltransferase/mannose-6-phosphate isomerase [Xenorhabdus bovienii]|uniref:mannose-1-phosphate guanylyltransferase/mannose-6-phosphate isomerase n=1 Tax=Xenorhabdus bovienii TaxID=40576 RepID=UPI0023B2FCEA|nr:mannose-1-phosphate guanylyltransferase/mannose-6-phosphate isomerase [Xenorhabdus bovienii]MDE9554964.1 mannose-1-phosphate guanylyltransferase/mannose-6-phosphate isomerase [Xenorhabdus bovienii]